LIDSVYNVLFSTALSNLEKCLFNSPPSAETIFRFLFSIHVSFLGCLTAFFWDGSRVISASGNILRYTVFQRKNFAVRVHRRTPTADAINGCGLRTDGEDIPPAARVRQSCTTAEQSQKNVREFERTSSFSRWANPAKSCRSCSNVLLPLRAATKQRMATPVRSSHSISHLEN
jgi:hypothetical protein